jgi:hypothetical protein
MEPALARELRENCGYLRDEGWTQSARLMELAADEIERLTAQTEQLRNLKGKFPLALSTPAVLPDRRPTALAAKVHIVMARMLARW